MNVDPDELLHQLSRSLGIAPVYTDVWGQPHTVPLSTHRALLRALGLRLAPPEADLAQLEQSRSAQMLEPVYVRSSSRPEPIVLRLRDTTTAVCWELVGPDIQDAGSVDPATLEPATDASCQGRETRRWPLPVPLSPGDYTLTLHQEMEHAVTRLVLCPDQCYLPPGIAEGGRVWGFSVQLYALRSQRNWGIGDFRDLGWLVDKAAELGATLIGVNPLHALFLNNPDQASPYSPSSRLFVNPLYLDLEGITEFADTPAIRARVSDPAFQAHLATLRATPLVDYSAVWSVKREILEALYIAFLARASHQRKDAFAHFQEHWGKPLQDYALHEALQEHFHHQDPSVWGWPVWPETFQHPDGPATRAFAATHQSRLGFFCYLQWQAEEQLAQLGAHARERLGIGLYRDLAVGVDRAGAETWANQTLYVRGASVGCPPDDFNRKGQDWGLPPPSQAALRIQRYEPFIRTLKANMRSAGALRIDHVMGLFRLFLVPDGSPATDGTYVHYPMEDLFRLLATCSVECECLIVGEDLGTVPVEISHAMAEFRVLSYRLLYFEQGETGYRAPETYPALALVTATTHDLPTLNGFWQGLDLVERSALNLFPTPDIAQQQWHQREQDRQRLWHALSVRGLIPPAVPIPAEADYSLILGIYDFLARTPAKLVLVQLDDMLLASHAVNLPGTVSERPNWRRKLESPLEEFPWEILNQLGDRMRAAGRGRPVEPSRR